MEIQTSQTLVQCPWKQMWAGPDRSRQGEKDEHVLLFARFNTLKNFNRIEMNTFNIYITQYSSFRKLLHSYLK